MERNPSTDSDVVQIEAKFVTGSNPKPSEPVIVQVPWSWRRTVENSSVIYTTPSGVCLSNFEDVKNYLLLDGTCKCGLECPLDYKSYFNFNPKARSVAAPVSAANPPVPNPARYCSRRSTVGNVGTWRAILINSLSTSCLLLPCQRRAYTEFAQREIMGPG